MFIVQSSRTMASARYLTEHDDGTITIDALAKRRERALQAARDAKAAKDAAAAKLAAERQQANAAISAANARLAEMRANGELDCPGYSPSVSVILRRISKATGFSVREIISSRRDKDLVLVRQAVCYWCVRLTSNSLPDIGRVLGGRDHTTVLHSRNAYPAKRLAMGRYLRPVR